MADSERIGYSRLGPAEKKLCDGYIAAFARGGDEVEVGRAEHGADVMRVYQVALGDHPEVVYVDRGRLKTTTRPFGGSSVRLVKLGQPAALRAELNRAADSAVREINDLYPATDYEKLLRIYEYLQDHVVYDEAEMESVRRTGDSASPHSHSAYGALVRGRAVCDGISSAFCLLAQRFGFACSLVYGEALFRTENFASHAWNVVKVGEKYYHCDATWDVNDRQRAGEYCYDYFCVDDDDVNTDHTWDVKYTPLCTGQELSFHRRNMCFAGSLSQLEEIFRRFAKSKTNVVRARISMCIPLTEPADREIGQLLVDAAASVGRYQGISYLWNKHNRCFTATFVD